MFVRRELQKDTINVILCEIECSELYRTTCIKANSCGQCLFGYEGFTDGNTLCTGITIIIIIYSIDSYILLGQSKTLLVVVCAFVTIIALVLLFYCWKDRQIIRFPFGGNNYDRTIARTHRASLVDRYAANLFL